MLERSTAKKEDHPVTKAMNISNLILAVLNVLGFIGLLSGGLIDWRIDRRIDTVFSSHQISQMASDIATMKGQVQDLRDDLRSVLNSELKKTSALNPKDFGDNSLRVGRIFDVAKRDRIRLPSQTIEDVRHNLLAGSQQDVSYWVVADSLIRYRSPVQEKQLLPCPREVSEGQSLIPLPVGAKKIPPSSFAPLLRDCRLDLSSGLPQFRLDPRIPFAPGELHCLRCQVYYSGVSQVPLIEGLRHLRFEQCSFDLSVYPQTPPSGKEFAQAVLDASDQQRVQIETRT